MRTGPAKHALLEKSDPRAWNSAIGSFQDRDNHSVIFSGKLEWCEGPEILQFRLKPLKLEKSCRLHRRFGADRFLVVTLPPFRKDDRESLHSSITAWLSTTTHWILDRQWRAFFIENNKRKQASDPNTGGFKVHLFAEDGTDFLDVRQPSLPPRTQTAEIRTAMTLSELYQWHIPFAPNEQSTDCKLFHRWTLGLSKTSPTVVLRPSEFIRLADEPGRQVMNDGCARMSFPLARDITKMLNLGHSGVPSAFQARIAGAKGLWMVERSRDEDYHGESERGYWIEIADSQLKIKPHPVDMLGGEDEKLTFEVLEYSRPGLKAASLNPQLLRILHSRGVPKGVFANWIRLDAEEIYTELLAAMDDRVRCRIFLQKYFPVLQAPGSPEYEDGWPVRYAQRSIRLLDSGFIPAHCHMLVDCMRKCLRQELDRRVERLHIKIPQSTFVYCIADPYGVLAEDEIHLTLSKPWEEGGNYGNELDGFNVLLARHPAHLQSDIQSRKAVYKDRLRHFKDVIVFPTQGETPLADLLSGGDYDGDRIWVCWSQDFVQNFQNAARPEMPLSVSEYGLVSQAQPLSKVFRSLKDTNLVTSIELENFVINCFRFNTCPSFLGLATVELENIAYDTGNMSCAEVVELAYLVSHLVDAPKQGVVLPEARWREIRATLSPKGRARPAYKNDAPRHKESDIIDYLHFSVAKRERDSILEKFHQKWKDVPRYDPELSRLWRDNWQQAMKEKKQDVPELFRVLTILKDQVSKAHDEWCRRISRLSHDGGNRTADFFSAVDEIKDHVKLIQPAESTHELVARWKKEEQMHLSEWALLKASLMHQQHPNSKFSLWTVSEELCRLKADVSGCPTQTVVGEIYQFLQIPSKVGKKYEGQLGGFGDMESDYGNDDEYDELFATF